jgi:hypothetical protein
VHHREKVLQFSVPLVTARSMSPRLVVLLLATPFVFVRARHWYRRRVREKLR